MTQLLLLLSTLGASPGLVVALPVATDVRPAVAAVVLHDVRSAVAPAEVTLVPVDNCVGRECLDVVRGRAVYLLTSHVWSQGSELRTRLELLDVGTGKIVARSLNSAPSVFGPAALDVSLLVGELLAVLGAPTRPPPPEKVVVQSEEVEEPSASAEVEELSRPAEPEVAPSAAPVTRRPPEPSSRQTALAAPPANPVPRAGVWVGSCVSYPQHGSVLLTPEDWKRYRRHRRTAE